ncbi:MAG TPA: hypothetical protein VFI72_15130, partial [Candidatus Angelobacter sp.]|nr:hypothetical protein [Candidatus Angelobacter sp.]
SAPFHLKATVTDKLNAASAYKAEIEEYWVSPEKWRRTVLSPGFSQTIIANGGKTSEQDTGDYYPFWLRDLVTALFDPLPMRQQLEQFKGQIELPTDSAKSSSCVNVSVPSGYGTVKTSLPYSFCFQGTLGLLQYVLTPGYRAEFQDYAPFKQKRVARRIVFSPDAATVIEARITELAELAHPDDALFTVDQPTPAAAQLQSSQIGEDTARRILVSSPDISWPAVREGKTSGIISAYISADKSGRVREVWPLKSDNPELTIAARQQVEQWKFQPYVNGVPMQMESVITLPFTAAQGAPVPVLTNPEARKLATHIVEPQVPAGAAAKGTKFTLRVAVNEQGAVTDVRNPGQVKPALWKAGERALRQWKFRPYTHDGTQDRFYADITFVVK